MTLNTELILNITIALLAYKAIMYGINIASKGFDLIIGKSVTKQLEKYAEPEEVIGMSTN